MVVMLLKAASASSVGKVAVSLVCELSDEFLPYCFNRLHGSSMKSLVMLSLVLGMLAYFLLCANPSQLVDIGLRSKLRPAWYKTLSMFAISFSKKRRT